jgi:hypothetical protein
MNILRNVSSMIKNEELWDLALKTTGTTALASVCAYGGTFFFTNYQPQIAATYFGLVALTSQVAYRVLEKLKDSVEKPLFKHLITVIQLLQIPFSFYFLHNGSQFLSAAVKLEMIAATAYFVAIPIFFHLGVVAWNDPTETKIIAAVGVMLPLASGLRTYAGLF